MSQGKNTVRVHIFDTEYPIHAEEDPDYIQKIAAYVDRRMREIPGSTATRLPMSYIRNGKDGMSKKNRYPAWMIKS